VFLADTGSWFSVYSETHPGEFPLASAPGAQSFLAETAAMHKHLCPRQILGVRMGLYAGDLLHLDLPQRDKRLYTFVETDGCFTDGVTVSTGCSVGHRTLRLMDYGKVAASFVDTKTGNAIRIWPNPQCRTRAAEYAPTEPNRWRAQLVAYQIMPAAELLCSEEIELLIDLNALIARPGIRLNCAGCGEEILNHREVILDGKALCRGCAGGGYVRYLSECAKG
jgi:formylmethanofuran dehydrogenase subunit E